jgi:hypothetical protein
MIYDLAGQGGPMGISDGMKGRTPAAKLLTGRKHSL